MRLLSVTRLILIAGIGFSACRTPTAVSTAPTADAQLADDQAAAELNEHHRHHHLGGVTQFIAMSLDTLGTDDEAKRLQVEQLQSDLYGCMAPGGEIANKLLQTLADGVAAGKIDMAKVDAILAQLSTSAATVHGCNIEALNKLHAILSPAERAALVDKVQAHWEVWRHVNHETEEGGREQGAHLAELARELNLTAEQVEKISASLHTAFAGLAGKFDPKKVEAHVQAFATAFVGESFDAKSVTADANAHLATHGSNRMALFYETVTPLLTPEQQTKLAAHLREHASHHPKAK